MPNAIIIKPESGINLYELLGILNSSLVYIYLETYGNYSSAKMPTTKTLENIRIPQHTSENAHLFEEIGKLAKRMYEIPVKEPQKFQAQMLKHVEARIDILVNELYGIEDVQVDSQKPADLPKSKIEIKSMKLQSFYDERRVIENMINAQRFAFIPPARQQFFKTHSVH